MERKDALEWIGLWSALLAAAFCVVMGFGAFWAPHALSSMWSPEKIAQALQTSAIALALLSAGAISSAMGRWLGALGLGMAIEWSAQALEKSHGFNWQFPWGWKGWLLALALGALCFRMGKRKTGMPSVAGLALSCALCILASGWFFGWSLGEMSRQREGLWKEQALWARKLESVSAQTTALRVVGFAPAAEKGSEAPWVFEKEKKIAQRHKEGIWALALLAHGVWFFGSLALAHWHEMKRRRRRAR